MSFSDLLIRWIAMAFLTTASGLWQGKTFGTNLLGIAILSATAMTGIAALHPLTELPGLWGIWVTWLRHLLIFVIIAAVLIGGSLRLSIIMSLITATVLTLARLIW